MKKYGQYCPIARAAELLAERWVLLVLREILMGSSRYNDIRRGVPLVSPSALSQRLKSLQQAGILEHRQDQGWHSRAYRLTAAGEALRPLIEQVGIWGQRWVRSRMTRDELDAGFLMWGIHRNIRTEDLPIRRTVIYFWLSDAKKGVKEWWLVMEQGQVDLCVEDPGHEVDVAIHTELGTITQFRMGELTLAAARSAGKCKIHGNSRLIQTLTRWLGRTPIAHIKVARTGIGIA